jgi:hypothetical protein
MFRLALRHRPGDVHWNWGYVLSAPIAVAIVLSRDGGDPAWSQHLAAFAILLGLPWILPAFIIFAVVSAPVYFWLRLAAPTPEVMTWLGATVLLGAAIGCHINAALIGTWLRRPRPHGEPGLAEFLRRPRNGAAH